MLRVALQHQFDGFALDVDFQAPSGITAIYGPSGSGKSTIVKSLAGLLRPEAGVIALGDRTLFDSANGHFVPPARRRIGVVFQEGRLFPHMRVRDNLLYGQTAAPTDPVFGLEHVTKLLGITHLLDRRPGTLSGGEAQRVAIGRALLSAPDLLLMDEPLASLDDRRKAEILPYLEKLRDGFGVPIVYISHSLTEVARLSTTLILLSDGKIIRAGRTVDVMSDPELLDYLGDAELGASLTATVGARVAETGLTEMLTAGGSVYLPDVTAEQGHTVRLRLPLRDCLLLRDASAGVAAETVLTGVVADITEHASGDVIYTIGIGEDRAPVRLTTAAARAVNLEIGATCSLVAQPVLDLTV